MTNRVYRFSGEVAAWPQRWDLTGRDVHVPLEASGVLRRLGNSSDALQSVMYRGLIFNSSGLVAYWPLEDAVGSTQIAAALDTHGPMNIAVGTPVFADFSDFVASAPLPTLNNAAFTGTVPAYTVGTETQVRFLLAVPAAGAENGQVILMFYGTGSVRRWEVVYGTGGTLELKAWDGTGALLMTSGAVTFTANGKKLLVSVELTQSGTSVLWNILTLEPGATSGLQFNGTLTTNTVGKIGIIVVSPGGGMLSIVVGHLSVQNDITSLFELGDQLNAWSGERVGRRIERLCSEAGIPFRALGDLDDTAQSGYQTPDSILNLIRAAVNTDMGMLYEPREAQGLGYRTRTSLYNQVAQLALDYSGHQLANALDPTDDDQSSVNDVTVTRDQGSSARSTLDSGPLSVLTPPNGIGRYSKSESLNIEHDLLLPDQARWRLRLGTVDEARYPQLPLNLAHPSITGNATLSVRTRSLEVGDLVSVSHLPAFLPPENARVVLQGYTEQMAQYEHDLVLNCSPASPYDAGVYRTANLATQGHFEVDTSSWSALTNSSIARVTTQKYAGSASLQITKTAVNPPNQIHGATLTGIERGALTGRLVTVEFYARIPAAVFSKVTALAIAATGITSTFITAPTAADTWTYCSLTTVLSANLASLQVQFWTDGTIAVSGVVAFIDALTIRVKPAAAEVDRYQPDAATLSASATSTAGTITVSTPLGPLWTTDDNEYPFDIMVAGERMTVLDISGSSSPQTFTVARSVNGIVKAQSSGAVVELVRKAVYGL